MVKIKLIFKKIPGLLVWLFPLLFSFPLLTAGFIYLKAAIGNLSYPYAILAGLEDENLARTMMVLKGESLYPSLNDYPFVVTLYPPLFYYLAALFVKILGVGLFPGRLLSLIASILVCLLCFLITWFLTKRFFWGVLAGLFFLASGYVQWWGLMFKNDILAVFFGLTGIFLFLVFEKDKKHYLSIPFFILALLTKQISLAMPLAVMAYLLFSKKDKKNFWRFSFWFIAPTALIFLLINLFSAGQFFVDIFLVPRSIPWDFNIFSQFWHGVFYSYGFLFYPAIGFLVFERILYKTNSLLTWCFLFSALARYDIGIVGSSENYFMETVALAGILTALLFNWLCSGGWLRVVRLKKNWFKFSVSFLFLGLIFIFSRQSPSISRNYFWFLGSAFVFFYLGKILLRRETWSSLTGKLNLILARFLAFIFLFIIWQKFIGLPFPLFSLSPFYFSPSPPSNLAVHQEKIDKLIQTNPGRVLIDSESFLAIKNNRDFEYIPMALKLRQQAGYWDFEKSLLYDDIGQQKFRFFIKSQGWTDPEIMYKIYKHYKLTKIVNAGAFFYEIFESTEDEYDDDIAAMRQQLDEAEIKDPTATEVFVKKIDKDKYLLGFTFADDNIYGAAFMNIVSHPQFKALYRPLHSRHPNSSVIFKARNLKEVEKIVALVFAGPGYTIFSEEIEKF